MVSHQDFRRLRLRTLFPQGRVDECDGWEFLGHTWHAESIGAWCGLYRLEKEPGNVAAFELTFENVSEFEAERMLDAIQLPVRAGMTFSQ